MGRFVGIIYGLLAIGLVLILVGTLKHNPNYERVGAWLTVPFVIWFAVIVVNLLVILCRRPKP